MEGARADTTDFGFKMGKKKRGAEEAAPNLPHVSAPNRIVREVKDSAGSPRCSSGRATWSSKRRRGCAIPSRRWKEQ